MYDGLIGYAGAFLRACEKEFYLPLPERLRRIARKHGNIQEAAMFVFAGFAAGVVIVAVSGIFGIFFNRFAGAVLFAALTTLLFLFHDRGRGDGTLGMIISDKLPGEYIPVNVIVITGMMILKFALLMRLFFHGNGLLLPLIMAGSFALETAMLMDAGFSPPVLNGTVAARRRYWVVLVLVLLFSFFSGKLACAFCAVLFAFFWYHAEKKVRKKGITAAGIRVISAACVWGMLLISALLI